MVNPRISSSNQISDRRFTRFTSRATKANPQNLSPFAINSNQVSDLSYDLCSINGFLLTDSSLDLCYLNEGPKQIIAYSYHSRSYLHHQQSFGIVYYDY
ncbi:hypothetical protein L1987_85698 [Smallanthus sonchifolius]|uniref:Uncharacterized protein n=1 Tax=Smallanthus sonchifolius TaxID=185202 RepID=A0ACB8XYV5_9ASTR|nr:hypothetical protein L1987_85698 [Smallanthus sonchifolius]